MAEIAAGYYGDPTRSLNVFGVTGTNGKTTLTYLLEAIFHAAGRTCGVLGTIEYRYRGKRVSAPMTTPESADLQKLFAEMKAGGVTDVVMEVSSHSLDQGRVAGIHFNGAAFTNLSWDHLDYHHDLEHYFEAKRRLFSEYLPASAKPGKFSVINLEDPRGAALCCESRVRNLRVSVSGETEVTTRHFSLSPSGIEAELCVEGQALTVRSPLLGRFNLENILVAIGVSQGAGIPLEAMARGIASLKNVPGRLEAIPNSGGFKVFVDYAHTPQALATVGATLRSFQPKRVLTVFGCGGDRDPGKRPEMGREVARFSDLMVVTSDNPRTEDPEKIIDQILAGIRGIPPDRIFRISDRRAAIFKALELAGPGDCLLIAGKGHEAYQIIGTKQQPFSDAEVVREFFNP